MTRLARFILALIIGLALLGWAASGVVQTTAREWFQRDVETRAQLVLTGASESLADVWYNPGELKRQLVSLARDERVIGAAACNDDLSTRSSTSGFPGEFSCLAVGPRVLTTEPAANNATATFHEWSTEATLPTGRVQVTARPIVTQGQQLGFAILVSDLSYIDRRESAAQTFLLVIFGILAVLAFGIPLLAAKRARTDWSMELRGLLRGKGKQKQEFQPILRDLRELVGHMATEREDAPELWTAKRLKQTLNRYLHGEKIIILANREPYIHNRATDGNIEVVHPASGLVTALEPIMRACSGVWVAHGTGSADRETVDRPRSCSRAASRRVL